MLQRRRKDPKVAIAVLSEPLRIGARSCKFSLSAPTCASRPELQPTNQKPGLRSAPRFNLICAERLTFYSSAERSLREPLTALSANQTLHQITHANMFYWVIITQPRFSNRNSISKSNVMPATNTPGSATPVLTMLTMRFVHVPKVFRSPKQNFWFVGTEDAFLGSFWVCMCVWF